MTVTGRLLAGLVAVLLPLAGCSTGTSEHPSAQESAHKSAQESAQDPASAREAPTTAPPPPPRPRVGTCHDLGYRAAAQVSAPDRTVPCRRRHTSQTMFVGTIDNLRDGHLATLDSDEVAAQVSAACPRRLARFTGGDRETRRLSRLQSVWFTPTPAESDRGATWFRCDVVALAGKESLLPLPQQARGMLDDPDVLARYGTCGTTAPDQKGFERVACARPHRWRAAATLALPADARYLAKGPTSDADGRCRDVAAAASDNALKFSWSFEWPSRTAWRDGQHWGWCWVPDR